MSRIAGFLLLLTSAWTPSGGDTEVYCVFTESCILPCSFQGAADANIHWTLLKPTNTSVHNYYLHQDQLRDQNQNFRGRTSLFQDQISAGNASLLLTEVEVQDEGRYRCTTDTIHRKEEVLINLRVYAPVGNVDIQQEGDRIACRSDGIYPEPNLTWSTSPTSNVVLKSSTIVQPAERHLYNISSFLFPSHSDTDLAYVCSVSTPRHARTAALRSRIKARIAIGQVVAVVLVAVSIGMVPCFYHRCKKLQSHIKSKCSGETKVV